jgi:hypothetical protein
MPEQVMKTQETGELPLPFFICAKPRGLSPGIRNRRKRRLILQGGAPLGFAIEHEMHWECRNFLHFLDFPRCRLTGKLGDSPTFIAGRLRVYCAVPLCVYFAVPLGRPRLTICLQGTLSWPSHIVV